jgi:hypothetical protein
VEVLGALEELAHVELDLAGGELDGGVLEQAGEVVVHVRKDHVDRALFVAGGCGGSAGAGTAHTDSQASTTMSQTVTTAGWLSIFRILISRRAVTGRPSFSLCMRMRLRATTRRVTVCVALWTSLVG